jgi:phenylalanyl-tRNA synthetase beta chain
MLVSFKWLQEFVDIDISPADLADRLTMAGLETGRIIEPGKDITGVVTGRVDDVSPHPNADKLLVVKVSNGAETFQIVTAATNIAQGDVVPVALEGARLAGGVVIKRAKLRGIESQGMMCSGRELGLDQKIMPAEQAHGIMILPPGTPLGVDARQVLGLDDVVLELELTPNRGDCLSIIGVAREVAALLGKDFRMPVPVFPEMPESIEGQVRVDIHKPDLCRRYVARLIKNVRAGSSPLWVQQRLRCAGIRPISNIVDVTNYVMLELGQPLHAFDYDLLTGHHIIVRLAGKDEKITSLDGVERELDPDMLVIADPSGAVAIAGVMGGLNSEVTPDTKSVLLESAFFDPVSIRRTAKRLGLSSESAQRFEKGIDLSGCTRAVDRAAQLIQDMGAGEVVAGVVDNYPCPAVEKAIVLRPSRVTHVLGVDVSVSAMQNVLSGLQFKIRDDGNEMLVTVPVHRTDVNVEIDLIEEIARMYGYHRLPCTLPGGSATPGYKTAEQLFTDKIRDVLAEAGLFEVVTYSFISPGIFDLINLPPEHLLRRAVSVKNPLSEEHSVMRTIMWPGLLEVLVRNYNRQVKNGTVFEIGHVFYPRGEGRQPAECPMLAAVVTGRTRGGWNQAPREMDFYYLKGFLEIIFDRAGVSEVSYLPEKTNPSFHPGRTACLVSDDCFLGIIGEIHPDVLEKFGLGQRAAAFEIDLTALFKVCKGGKKYQPISRFPGVDRDLAVVISQDVPAQEVFKVIRESGGMLLKEVELFDLYYGRQVPEGCRSMAFTLKFQALDRTLTDTEVTGCLDNIANDLRLRLGAKLRV